MSVWVLFLFCVRNQEFIVIQGHTRVFAVKKVAVKIKVAQKYGTELNFETRLIPE